MKQRISRLFKEYLKLFKEENILDAFVSVNLLRRTQKSVSSICMHYADSMGEDVYNHPSVAYYMQAWCVIWYRSTVSVSH